MRNIAPKKNRPARLGATETRPPVVGIREITTRRDASLNRLLGVIASALCPIAPAPVVQWVVDGEGTTRWGFLRQRVPPEDS